MRAALVIVGILLFGTFVSVSPGLGQPSEGNPGEISDGTGDQTFNFTIMPPGVGPQPMPQNTFSPTGDIVGVRFEQEDRVGLDVVVTLAALKVGPRGPSLSQTRGPECPFDEGYFRFGGAEPNSGQVMLIIDFALDGSRIHYQLGVRLTGHYMNPGATNEFVVEESVGRLCISEAGENGTRRLAQAVGVKLDESSKTVRIHVEKAALLGQRPAVDSPFGRTDTSLVGPPKILPGDRFVRYAARALMIMPGGLAATFGAGVIARDVAPDSGFGTDYVVQHPAPNAFIRLAIPRRGETLPVPTGVNWTVPISLTNLADGKRLVRLSYGFEAPEQEPFGYTAWGPTTISVPAGESRNFSIAVDVPANADAADNVSLVVAGESLGFGAEIAYAAALLAPSPPLGPDANVLYLHRRNPQPNSGNPAFDAFSVAGCTAFSPISSGCIRPFLSDLAEDPLAANPDRLNLAFTPDGQGNAGVRHFDAPFGIGLPMPMAVAPGQPVSILLSAKTAGSTHGIFHAHLGYSTRVEVCCSPIDPIVEVHQEVTITPSGTVLNLSAPIAANKTLIVPVGSILHLRLEFDADLTAETPVTMALGGLEIAGGGASRVELPLVPPPLAAVGLAQPGFFQLTPTGSVEDFVNPGEARLFGVTLLNQDGRPHRANLTATVFPPTWRAQVVPGNAFELNPGDAIRVGLLLWAPKDAKEGELGQAWLNASQGAEAPASLRVSALALNLDFPDDSKTYQADREASERLVRPPPETPGFAAWQALVAALAVLTTIAAIRSRRS